MCGLTGTEMCCCILMKYDCKSETLGGAVRNLKEQRLSSALQKLYQVDNNAYAFNFDEEVYSHFTDYVFHQPKDRLKWGYRKAAAGT